MEIKDRTIALLIDSDNISRNYYSILLDELSKFGRVTYRRLYGDFSKSKSNGWKDVLLEYSIEQMQQIAYTTGKNATDSSLIIDAMDILYRNKVDCFCLATSDSDFTGLAMRFRNDDIIVIGAGEAKTPDSFRKACDRFIAIDELLKAKSKEAENSKITLPLEKTAKESSTKNTKAKKQVVPELTQVEKLKNLVEMTKQIISDKSEADGWMLFSTFVQEIYRKENDFNPKLYGHSNGNATPFFKSLKDEKGNAILIIETTDNVSKVKLNK